MNIPENVKSAVSKADHIKKIDRLARQFKSFSKKEYYPRKRHLVEWLFDANMHMTDEVWEQFKKIDRLTDW